MVGKICAYICIYRELLLRIDDDFVLYRQAIAIVRVLAVSGEKKMGLEVVLARGVILNVQMNANAVLAINLARIGQ